MDFTLNPNANTNSTSKRGEIPDITTSMMEQAFGDSVRDADDDLEAGYSGNAWYFVSGDGQVITVYERFHTLRVGAHSDSIFEPFVVWLRDMIAKSKQHDELQRIFVDDFSNNANGWQLKEDTETSLSVENGGYIIEQRQDSGWRATWKQFENHTRGDLSIRVKIQKILGASDSYFGIIWGGDANGNFNSLLLNFKKQFYFGKYINKEWTQLAPWQPAPIRHEAGSVNEIAIFAQKGNIELHINGFRVLKHEWNSTINGNYIGFLAGHSLKIKVLSIAIHTDNSVQIPKVSDFSPPTIKRTHVDSSNLKSVGYDNISQVLEVEFTNGAVYQYFGVPQRIYVELMQAESHGKYFYALVRDRFQYQQVRNKQISQTNYYDDYDHYDEQDGYEAYDTRDLKDDLGMDFMSDDEFDTWLEDEGRD